MRTTSRLALCAARGACAVYVLVSYKSRIPMCVLVQKAVARLCTTLYEVCRREVADPQVTLLYPYWCGFLPVPVPVLVGRA